jgi:hypothetical protein
MQTAERPVSNPEPELRLLSILHYVLAAITATMFPIGVVLIVLGKPLLYPDAGTRYASEDEAFAMAFMGAVWIMAGALLTTLSLLHGSVLWYVGRCIALRRRWRLVVVFSIFNLTYIPLGTAVSGYTLAVVCRRNVRVLFAEKPREGTKPKGE